MGAPKGNEFWKMVKLQTGRPKRFESPDKLWEEACQYFQWIDDNPFEVIESEKSLKDSKEKVKYHKKPYTIQALCLYLGVNLDTFNNYGKREDYKEFFDVVKQIKDIIYSQKFEGAAAGLFKDNIIARDLGLIDSKKIDHEGEVTQKNIIKFGDSEVEV